MANSIFFLYICNMSNLMLENAKLKQNNEFYSITSEVSKELVLYKSYYKNASIFLPCNDAIYRGITNFFIEHFNEYGIKRLAYAEYGKGENGGKLYLYDGKVENVIQLKNKGDFRISWCLKAIEMSDIIITGPPYSLFSDFINILFSYNKKFLVLGECLGVSYVNVFPFVLEKKMWFGITTVNQFIVPDWYTDSTTFIGEDGTRRCKRQKDVWYTNMKASMEKPFINLPNKYDVEKYDKCDNLDAIWIDDSRNIPKDYDGLMCVSCQFLRKINLDQFEIVDCKVPYYKGERKLSRILIKNKKTMLKNFINVSEIITKLNSLVETKGLSRTQFAKEVGMNPSDFIRQMNGERTLTELTLKRVADYCNLDVEYFGITEEDVKAFLAKYPQCSEESRRKISKGIRTYYIKNGKSSSYNEHQSDAKTPQNTFSKTILYVYENIHNILENGKDSDKNLIYKISEISNEYKKLAELKEKRENLKKEFEIEQAKYDMEIAELEKKCDIYKSRKKINEELEIAMAKV